MHGGGASEGIGTIERQSAATLEGKVELVLVGSSSAECTGVGGRASLVQDQRGVAGIAAHNLVGRAATAGGQPGDGLADGPGPVTQLEKATGDSVTEGHRGRRRQAIGSARSDDGPILNNGRATVGVLTRQRLGVGTRLNEVDRPHKSRCGHSWLHAEAVLNDAAEAGGRADAIPEGERLGALAACRHRPDAAVVGEGRVVGHDTASGGVEAVDGLVEAAHVKRTRGENLV